MGTAGEGEGKCVGLLVSELSLACSVFLQKIFLYASLPLIVCMCTMSALWRLN
jgi:hypothetical protein